MPNKLTDHWCASYYEQTFSDYHFCVCYDKKLDKAYIWKNPKIKPEDNDNTSDGKYAPHCKGCNTGNIGIGVCAMVGFDMKNKQSSAPLNKKQFELMCKLNAECAYKYKFKINEDTVATHSERNPGRKIDIDYLPFIPNLKKENIYTLIRNKTNWYYNKILKNKGELDIL
jgi:hypothetical protein